MLHVFRPKSTYSDFSEACIHTRNETNKGRKTSSFERAWIVDCSCVDNVVSQLQIEISIIQFQYKLNHCSVAAAVVVYIFT